MAERDYAELVTRLRKRAVNLKEKFSRNAELLSELMQAADAIEELLAFARFVAREAIDTGDNDGVSAEILCRKLNKLGLVETDGEFWTLPAPPKEEELNKNVE